MITAIIPRDQLVDVTIYRSSGQTSGVGAQPVDVTPVMVAEEEKAHIIKLSGGQAERMFGKDSKARWRGLLSNDADIEEYDLIEINGGPYEDTVLEIASISQDEMALVELQDTNRTTT